MVSSEARIPGCPLCPGTPRDGASSVIPNRRAVRGRLDGARIPNCHPWPARLRLPNCRPWPARLHGSHMLSSSSLPITSQVSLGSSLVVFGGEVVMRSQERDELLSVLEMQVADLQDIPRSPQSHKISQDDLPWPPLISLLPRPSLTSPPRTSSAIAAPPKCLTYSAGQRLRGREGRLDPTWPRTARAYRRTRCAATHRSCLHG